MRSNNYITSALLSVFLSLTTAQAQDMAAYFANMPAHLTPELEANRKKDLIDLYKENQTPTVENSLKGIVALERLSDDYLKISSGSWSLEMMLLTMINDSKIICAAETRCAPVCDSKLRFYTVDWKPLDSRHILQPVDASWFIREEVDTTAADFAAIQASLALSLMEFRLHPEDHSITQVYNTPKYLNKEEYEKAKPFLKDKPKVYHWRQLQFD